MKEIHLSTGHYIALPLPEGATDPYIQSGDLNWYMSMLNPSFLDPVLNMPKKLPEGQWTIIGTTKEIGKWEDLAASICQMRTFSGSDNRIFAFKVYDSEDKWNEDVFVSFASLCQLHQIGENDIWLRKLSTPKQ